MQIRRPDKRHPTIALNLQILIIQIIQETDEIFLIEIEVQMIQVHPTSPGEWIIVIVDDHQDVSYYFSVVDCLGIGGIWAKGKGFVGDSGSDVDID